MKKSLISLLLALIMILSLTGCEFLENLLGGSIKPPVQTHTPSDTDSHFDEDNDGKCDECETSVLVVVDFYAINDMHGKLEDTSDNVGADNLTTYLKGQMSRDDHSVLLSSGDMWQGSAESNLTHGLMMTDWMNEIGFASMTMGNHEYDWGREFIEANNALADFPFLGINIIDKSTNERIDYCDASVVVEKGNIKIGIIGAIGDCYSSISGDMTSGFSFATGSALTNLIKAESDRLRNEEDVDFVVLSLHDGYGRSKNGIGSISAGELQSFYDLTLSSGYVDLCFEGHTHQSYILKDARNVYHMQAGGENKSISHIEIGINFANNKKSVREANIITKNIYGNYPADKIIDDLTEKYEEELSKANEVLGTLNREISSYELTELVAKLYYLKGIEVWGNEYPIVLGGGFISARSPYDLRAGDVTYADIYSILPFDNQLALCSISGADLMRVFVETTNNRYHTYWEEYGSDAIANIDPNGVYYVVTDSYSSTYDSNNLTEIARLPAGIYARDLVADYIRAGRLI